MSVMATVTGWLAPPLCVSCGAEGRSLCAACSMTEIIPFGERCWHCLRLSARCKTCDSCRVSGGPRRVWVTTDYGGAGKDLIQKYKFGHQRAAAGVLAQMMAETFWMFNSRTGFDKANYLVVPVPSATSRVRQRGFDHAGLLAQKIATGLDLTCKNALVRSGQTRQVGTKRADRLTYAQKSYFAQKPSLVSGKNILLVDDIITTGATLQAAGRQLRAAGARHVDALVFAKSL